jgi:hypothetical protein
MGTPDPHVLVVHKPPASLRVAGVLVAMGRPVLRLLNKAMRATRPATTTHSSCYPSRVAAYPAGDPQLCTSDERLASVVEGLFDAKARWARTTSAERAELARACASRVKDVRGLPAPLLHTGQPRSCQRRDAHSDGAWQVAESMAVRDREYKGAYETGTGAWWSLVPINPNPTRSWRGRVVREVYDTAVVMQQCDTQSKHPLYQTPISNNRVMNIRRVLAELLCHQLVPPRPGCHTGRGGARPAAPACTRERPPS